MIKEFKYLIFIIMIITFFFLAGKYYFSDENKKNSYRSLKNINISKNLYAQDLAILISDTVNIIEYAEVIKTNNKKKYHFWKLINKND